jgi:multiple sugar transport system permease protein
MISGTSSLALEDNGERVATGLPRTSPRGLFGRPGKARSATTYLYLLPAVILLVGIFAVPLVQAVVLSLQKSAGLAGTSGWAGLRNYEDEFKDPLFWQIALQTVIWTVGVVVTTVVVALSLAALLQGRFRGRTVLRVALMIPWASSLAVSAVIWGFALQPNGLVDRTMTMLGLHVLEVPWLANTPQVTIVLIAVGIWASVPFGTVLLSAAMQAIPREIYEAASLESRSQVKRAWFITIPMLKQVLLIVTMANFVTVFNSFPIIYVMTDGGPINKTEILATYLYEKAFSDYDFGHAAALAVIVTVVLLAASLLYVRLLLHSSLKVGIGSQMARGRPGSNP